MPKSSFVDFKAVKAAITMEQVLEHYGLLDKFKRGSDSLSGPCPIHKGSNPTQFRVSISKNIWNCFSECKHGGNVRAIKEQGPLVIVEGFFDCMKLHQHGWRRVVALMGSKWSVSKVGKDGSVMLKQTRGLFGSDKGNI